MFMVDNNLMKLSAPVCNFYAFSFSIQGHSDHWPNETEIAEVDIVVNNLVKIAVLSLKDYHPLFKLGF